MAHIRQKIRFCFDGFVGPHQRRLKFSILCFNNLDILLPGKRPFVAPSAVVQARQRLEADVIRLVFEKTRLNRPGFPGVS